MRKGIERRPCVISKITESVSLLDWLTATNQFITTGNAAALAAELTRANNPALQPLAETVENIATGLHLLRPQEVSTAAATLAENLTPVRQELPPPFILLSESLAKSYSSFGQEDKTDPTSNLIYQLEMINWYHDRGQIVHALSLAREWVVSYLCLYFKLNPEEKKDREEMEFLVGGGKLKREGEIIKASKYLEDWAMVPEAKRLRKLWGGPYELANLRNDVLHSGFRKNPKSAADVLDAADRALNELKSIATALNISNLGLN